MKNNTGSYRNLVEGIVSNIPKGRVMTYGQIAALTGKPRASRIVGGIAHFGDPDLPWHRVVNYRGGLAVGYPGGIIAHKDHLEAEGVVFNKLNLLDLSEFGFNMESKIDD